MLTFKTLRKYYLFIYYSVKSIDVLLITFIVDSS